MEASREELTAYAEAAERRYLTLEQEAAGAVGLGTGEPRAYHALVKELASLRDVVGAYRSLKRLERELAETESMRASGERDLAALAEEEAARLSQRQEKLLGTLRRHWQASHQEPDRSILVEIRAGAGGQEASLFVGDLSRMYFKYAARVKLAVEPMHAHPSEAGGFKELVFGLSGPGAWARFRHERGVHRVQRVPATEAQGRIHTSTVTVAVLPEPEEVELPPVPPQELQIDVYRSSGPGGQGVNTTDSAVRIRHIPTGLIVTCQDERSQLRNRDKALRVLRARLLERIQERSQAELAANRRQQVGTGERSEKIRTYNFPDRRVTDHRIGLTLHQLDAILEGNLDQVHEALEQEARARRARGEPP
ncbi:MAG TPA: peptide chain release factor 1 [bacterium]